MDSTIQGRFLATCDTQKKAKTKREQITNNKGHGSRFVTISIRAITYVCTYIREKMYSCIYIYLYIYLPVGTPGYTYIFYFVSKPMQTKVTKKTFKY